MMIEQLMHAMRILIQLAFAKINIPGLPDEASEYLNQFIDLLDGAAGLFSLVFPVNVLPFVVICLAITAGYHVYSIVMWVLKKIPLLGIE